MQLPQNGRHWVATTFDQVLGASEDKSMSRADVALVVTELLTNAVHVGRTSIDIRLSIHRNWVEIEVTDDGAGMPEQRDAKLTDTGGRGLAIVDAIAACWGVRPAAGDAEGKTVWARLALEPEAPEPLHCEFPELVC